MSVVTLTTMVDAAREYARRGWPVFPVHGIRDKKCACGKASCDDAGKHPRTAHGLLDASRDEKPIRAWWTQWPDANIGLRTGNDVLVVDVDPRHEGDNTLAALEQNHGAFPVTLEARTGGGGRHLFFALRNGQVVRNSTGKLGPGVDVRGAGGYVMLPPSHHLSGNQYQWVNEADLAPLPEWLAAKLAEPEPRAASANDSQEKIPEGQRNGALTSLAGSMRRRGFGPDAIEAALLIENEKRCDPLLSAGEVHTIALSVSRYEPARAEAETISGPLPERIRAVVLDNTIPSFDKRRRIAELIEDSLRQRGEFCRTLDERLFFFETGERRLYDLEEICFGRMLTNLSGLSATEAFYKFALDILQARQAKQARLVTVHSFAYHDPETSLLAVSDGAGGVWFRGRGGQWRLGRNGEQGLYFATEREGSPWVPEFSATPDALDWFLESFCFADALLSREEARTAFTVWMFQQFFPELRRTRIIPTFLGQQGSGKTTGERLVGRLLIGSSFDVMGIQREREDGFVAAVTNRVVLGLDNADSKIPWLADSLALYATGQKYRLRRLYTTNEEVSYLPRAILMISSRDPQFNRPDVSERLLPIHCERPERYFTEAQIFNDLEKRRGAVMGALLNQVGRIADYLEETEPRAMAFRMADFASFGERVFRPTGGSGEWLDIMGKIERAQSDFASEGDGIVTAILELVARGVAIDEMSIGDLFKKCCDIGEKEGLLLPKSLQGFGRALTTRRRVIELEGDVRFQEFRGEHRRRFVTIRKGAAKNVGAS
ncbi:MAG: bifunctional DNA primase/polymerase [Candidatus Acidiferrales bacterium]